METTTLVRFDQNEDASFYLCRQCKTHVALQQELLHKIVHNHHGLFNNMVNVALGQNYAVVTDQITATASCINCNSNFGAKFISLKFETPAIKAGRFMIDMTNLLLWKGNRLVYAHTEEPVQNA
ncbi:Unknown protein [Striga hermonthica]|uniref:Yippee domain-containing protein n=1 Tax=Striga hermonthica TaxID=68872 RepID=A0A9N7NU61_STRHE|nr:Unknown protein [Striga hermonthica]